MSETFETIAVSSHGDGRLDVVIDRPQVRNALSIATLQELATVFTDNADDESLKVVVITGAGDKAFAAGGDLKELSQRRFAADAEALFDLGMRTTRAVRRFPVPVVAALNGVAIGGGAELAVSCDFRVASANAAIGFVQAQLGLTTGFGGFAGLTELVGPRRASLMMLGGAILQPAQAFDAGLVDAVTAEGEGLEALVDRFVEPILKRSAELVRDIKALALAASDAGAGDAVGKVERERFVRAWVRDEHWTAADKVLSRNKVRTT